MTYSTCSLNPIENEAVVAACIRNKAKAGTKDEIIDARSKLGSFRTRPGLQNWTVCDDFEKMTKKRQVKAEHKGTLSFEECFDQYDSWESVPADRRCLIKETMFPGDLAQL